MNRKFVLPLIVVIAVVVAITAYVMLLKPALDNRTIPVVTPAVIGRPDLALEFSFPSGEEGYTMIEQAGEPAPTSTEPTGSTSSTVVTPSVMRHMFVLMDTSEYTAYQAAGSDLSVPPAISIIVFDNSGDQTEGDRMSKLRSWAARNVSLTAFNASTTQTTEVELDGVDGIQYQVEGDSLSTVYTLASYREKVYFFAGQYQSTADDIRKTYDSVLNSVTFY